ncbi:MAG TPA: hypothetical protein VEG35_01715, partial [Burkholderiales bacterium]|nr:hypothetical protein [Burkholderiales bacterium]
MRASPKVRVTVLVLSALMASSAPLRLGGRSLAGATTSDSQRAASPAVWANAPRALALAASAKELKLTEGLAVGLIGLYGRSPVPADLVAWQLATGTLAPPREGLVIGMNAAGQPRAWARVTAGAEGWIENPALAGGSLFIVIDSQKARTMILEASSFYVARINGEPRGGEKYGADWVRHPVRLVKGKNEFLIQCERGRFRGRLAEPPAEVFFTDADMTLPDLIIGERGPVWAGLRLVNATGERLTGIEVLYRAGGNEVRVKVNVTVPPLMAQKLAVPLSIDFPSAEGTVPVEVQARARAGSRGVETPVFKVELKAVPP